MLDDGFAGEDDVGCSVEEGAAGDLVACVLHREERLGVWIGEGGMEDRGGGTVSIYSPRAAVLGGMVEGGELGHAGCFGQLGSRQADVSLHYTACKHGVSLCKPLRSTAIKRVQGRMTS